jgi:hypothetical protein
MRQYVWYSCFSERIENRCAVVPLYAARVCDLKPGDFVVVDCGGCRP